MTLDKKQIHLIWLIAFSVIIDQLSKFLITDLLARLNIDNYKVTDFLNLVEVYNHGVTFGLFNNIQHGREILSVLAFMIIIILFVWIYKEKDYITSISISLILGGAIGNLIDRIRFGAVTDFIDFHIMGYHWYTFNIADSFICVGAGIMLINTFFQKNNEL